VVDEINRGNLAKVFGELYFLLEYRDRGIALQYSPEVEFRLPPNLFIIGTMNTADRSIALVDSALRRRFYFVPFTPTEPPFDEVLRRWLGEHDLDPEPAQLLAELNAMLAAEPGVGDEFAIGPSYLMSPDGSPPRLEHVWRYAIQPLLEERFFGVKSRAEVERDFGLVALRRRLRAAVAEEPSDVVESDN
jgi:5-methylcytosine-specific restriction protein B